MSNNKSIKNYKKWLKRFASLFSREPADRDALIEILRSSEHRKLLDPDALLMIEGALQVSEIQVRDIMIPRVQMIVVKDDAEPEDILSVVGSTRRRPGSAWPFPWPPGSGIGEPDRRHRRGERAQGLQYLSQGHREEGRAGEDGAAVQRDRKSDERPHPAAPAGPDVPGLQRRG